VALDGADAEGERRVGNGLIAQTARQLPPGTRACGGPRRGEARSPARPSRSRTNDAPTSKPLESFKDLVNGLTQVEERAAGDPTTVTHRRPTIAGRTASKSPASRRSTTCSTKWLSPELAKRQTDAFVLRRTKLTRDGTDHDPAWVTLNL
jgi:hypothetical protein